MFDRTVAGVARTVIKIVIKDKSEETVRRSCKALEEKEEKVGRGGWGGLEKGREER